MMYLAPDDMSERMLILGTVNTFVHPMVTSLGTVEHVKTQVWDHHGKIYRILAIQLPLILVEMAWNSENSCIGAKRMIDTRSYHFMKPNPAILSALGLS